MDTNKVLLSGTVSSVLIPKHKSTGENSLCIVLKNLDSDANDDGYGNYLRVVVLGNLLAEFRTLIEKNVLNDSKLSVEGRLRNSYFTDSLGRSFESCHVVADRIEIL
ncbi:MAG: single-stranded DNA-binding protein [Succinivibrio sp.]